MDFNTIILLLASIVIMLWAIIIKFTKNISLIPSIKKDKISKIKKVDKVANDFGNKLFLMGLSIFISSLGRYLFGTIGAIPGLILLVLFSLNYSTLAQNVDSKIKTKEY